MLMGIRTGILLWGLAAVLATGIVIIFLVWVLRRVRLLASKRISGLIPDAAEILLQDSGANFLGLQSLGGMQMRGNRGLALTADGLYFCMLVPRRNLEISLDSITETRLVRSHCGKTVFYDLLKVTYRTEQGGVNGQESAAWYVRDAGEWKRVIDQARDRAAERASG